MTFKDVLKLGEEILSNAQIADAKIDAWLIMEWVAKISKADYFLRMNENVGEEIATEYFALIKRRAERIPLQYITGEQEFMGHTFEVNQNVLIPRADTEILAEEAIKRLSSDMKVLDVCTGSGCILISLMLADGSVSGMGVDISKQALNVAKENARKLGVTPEFIKSDMLDQVTGEFDMIVSNPPYIRTDEIIHLMPEVRDYEPIIALDGKEDGLYFYRKLISASNSHLKDNGLLIMEIGCDQANDVGQLMENEGFTGITVVKDLAGLDRVMIGEKGHV